jgi:hypothetical protein
MGVALGETELFWVYYPDMRPIFSRYEVYNGKNFGARMSWKNYLKVECSMDVLLKYHG